MRENSDATIDQTCGPQLQEALTQIRDVVLDGLRHGHFRATIFCEIGKGNRRSLVIEAGKSRKFTIPEEEVPKQHRIAGIIRSTQW